MTHNHKAKCPHCGQEFYVHGESCRGCCCRGHQWTLEETTVGKCWRCKVCGVKEVYDTSLDIMTG